MRKEILVLFFILSLTGGLIQSCHKIPDACFTVNGDISLDTVHINQVVTFDANCSTNTHDFNWQFYNNPDSINFGPVIIKTFKDTATVNVFLFVTNGNEYNQITRDIHVVH